MSMREHMQEWTGNPDNVGSRTFTGVISVLHQDEGITGLKLVTDDESVMMKGFIKVNNPLTRSTPIEFNDIVDDMNDEIKDYQKYQEQAARIAIAGRNDIALALEIIAREEKNHYEILKALLLAPELYETPATERAEMVTHVPKALIRKHGISSMEAYNRQIREAVLNDLRLQEDSALTPVVIKDDLNNKYNLDEIMDALSTLVSSLKVHVVSPGVYQYTKHVTQHYGWEAMQPDVVETESGELEWAMTGHQPMFKPGDRVDTPGGTGTVIEYNRISHTYLIHFDDGEDRREGEDAVHHIKYSKRMANIHSIAIQIADSFAAKGTKRDNITQSNIDQWLLNHVPNEVFTPEEHQEIKDKVWYMFTP